MTEFFISEKIEVDILKKIIFDYFKIPKDFIIITNNLEEITEIKKESKKLWCNLSYYKFGDFKMRLEFFEDKLLINQRIELARKLAQTLGLCVLSDFGQNLKDHEWILIDSKGCKHLVQENFQTEYSKNEEGITLTKGIGQYAKKD